MAGLTTALLLSKNPDYSITVAAKHMPGDYDIEYASPWAGADYLPLVITPLFRFLWLTVCTMIADKPVGFLLQGLRLQSGTRIPGQNWKN